MNTFAIAGAPSPAAVAHDAQRDRGACPVAILRPDAHPGSNSWRLAWYEPTEASGLTPVPAVPRLWHLDTRGAAHAQVAPTAAATALAVRTAQRQRHRLNDCRPLLGNGTFETGEHTFCELERDSAKPSLTAFSNIRLGAHVHHVFARGLRNVPREAAQVEEINLVTGVCLFSDAALSLTAARGRRFTLNDAQHGRVDEPLRAITAEPSLTLYELESTTRPARSAADLVSALPARPPVTVTLDVPRFQYYFYLLDLVSTGGIDAELPESWFELVDRRRDRVVAVFGAALRRWLAAAGATRQALVRTATALDVLVPEIRSGIRAGIAPAASELAAQLARSDPIWQRVTEAITTRDWPG